MEIQLIYPEFFQTYISKIDTSRNCLELLEEGMRGTMLAFKFISEEKANYKYAPDKWSIKELLGHMIDTEIIMAYRALRISRGDQTPLPGFDEQQFVENSNFKNLKTGDLLEHYKMVRFSNILLFKNFSQEMWGREGNSNGNKMNAIALAYIIAGHEAHHLGILRERYGIK